MCLWAITKKENDSPCSMPKPRLLAEKRQVMFSKRSMLHPLMLAAVLQDLQVWRARLNSKVGKVRQEMDLLRDSMTTQVHGLRQELDDLQVQSF